MKVWKIISKALFGMHLWLPIAYSVVFVAVAAITEKLDGSWPYYFIGLSLSFAASLGLVYFSASRAKSRVAEKQPLAEEPTEKKEKRRPLPTNDYESVEDAAARIQDEQTRYAQAMKATPSGISGAKFADAAEHTPPPKAEAFMRPETMQQYYGDAARPETTAQSAHDALYSSFSAPAGYEETAQSNFSPYVQPANVASPQSPKLDDYDAERLARREEPKIYRTRKEPNVLIYEYSDCIEKYYLNSDGSLTFLSTETKR